MAGTSQNSVPNFHLISKIASVTNDSFDRIDLLAFNTSINVDWDMMRMEQFV